MMHGPINIRCFNCGCIDDCDLRPSLVCDVMQRTSVVSNRRFGTNYVSTSPLQGSSSLKSLLDPPRWARYVVPKRR